MGLIATLVVGAIAGWLTGWLINRSSYGLVPNILLGIVGSVVGGWVTSLLIGVDLVSGFNLTTILVSVLGSVIVVMIYRLITRRSVT
jgi:uncharacterized membrane protein YeaQ/YmgE (transglycosylase-associated protein family)